MFRVTDPTMIPSEVPDSVRDAIQVAWTFDRDTAAQYDWGDRPLHVLRFRLDWMRLNGSLDVMRMPQSGRVEYSANILRRLVARGGGFKPFTGFHEGTAVVTAGVTIDRRDVDAIPDPGLPDDELRRWADDARAAGLITEWRGTIGVHGDWRFRVEETRGQDEITIVGHEPGSAWQDPHDFINEVVKLDEYLRSAVT